MLSRLSALSKPPISGYYCSCQDGVNMSPFRYKEPKLVRITAPSLEADGIRMPKDRRGQRFEFFVGDRAKGVRYKFSVLRLCENTGEKLIPVGWDRFRKWFTDDCAELRVFSDQKAMEFLPYHGPTLAYFRCEELDCPEVKNEPSAAGV